MPKPASYSPPSTPPDSSPPAILPDSPDPPGSDPFANGPQCPFPPPNRYITAHCTLTAGANFNPLPFIPEITENMSTHQYLPGVKSWNLFATPHLKPSMAPPEAGPGGTAESEMDLSSVAGSLMHTSSDEGSSERNLPPEAPGPAPSLGATISKNKDLEFYHSTYISPPEGATSPPPVYVKGGTVFRIIDIAPGAIIPTHRTLTLDYAFVIAGRVVAILDSCDFRMMEPGDVLVNRGTMHGWKESSGTAWARIGIVLVGLGGCPDGVKVPMEEGVPGPKQKLMTEYIPWEIGMEMKDMVALTERYLAGAEEEAEDMEGIIGAEEEAQGVVDAEEEAQDEQVDI